MKQKLALLLAGLLVGGLLMSVVPASGQTPTAFRRLKNKVERLEKRLNRLQRMVNNRTQLLTADGFYDGPVIGEQVLSLCAAGSNATWQDTGATLQDGTPISWIDTCFPAMPTSRRDQPSARQLQQMLGR